MRYERRYVMRSINRVEIGTILEGGKFGRRWASRGLMLL